MTTLVMPSLGVCESSSHNVKEGKRIYMEILSRHKRVDKSYREPFIWGSGTNNPLCCILIPSRDWISLPESKKHALAQYVASLVNLVKDWPFKYSGVSSNAPAASFVAKNIAKMTSNSWCIMVGQVSPDGRDITIDHTAMSGQEK